MVTTFNRSDLVSFGNYLLRTQNAREASIRKGFEDSGQDWEELDVIEQLKLIKHADIENWKAEKDKRTTRAKFIVDSVQVSQDGSQLITMSPVMEGAVENENFWKYTPSGNIGLGLSAECEATFEEGAAYYVDFKKAGPSTNRMVTVKVIEVLTDGDGCSVDFIDVNSNIEYCKYLPSIEMDGRLKVNHTYTFQVQAGSSIQDTFYKYFTEPLK